ncbi:MAG: hypothetical protein A2287_10090 [Candidatus Melainabacteria bacterium RIFOXYA12_FULL_32_12]|nr:MAG: hypothetical protein A2255_06540 [Candidatus Melainabacteria bacterium RIFOXYA2_FULL_32_9]OGI26007.1 MAG: hypothetical protein A2287_10090 [Candidatus Melainabacteria bacterium RIFOXYA12_FULL_32_12]
MAAINSVNVEDQIKKLALVATPTNTAATATTANKVHGLTFKTTDEGGIEQNTAVFNSLDSEAQQIIKSAIGDEAWVRPEKIAEELKKAGYQVEVGGHEGSGTEKYMEVTGKDGEKYRIWDIGGDNGIGTQDINFNGALAGFKEDIGSVKTENTLNNDNKITSVYTTNEAKPEEKKADLTKDADIRQILKTRLESMGYKDPAEIEKKIDELLRYGNDIPSLIL